MKLEQEENARLREGLDGAMNQLSKTLQSELENLRGELAAVRITLKEERKKYEEVQEQHQAELSRREEELQKRHQTELMQRIEALQQAALDRPSPSESPQKEQQEGGSTETEAQADPQTMKVLEEVQQYVKGEATATAAAMEHADQARQAAESDRRAAEAARREAERDKVDAERGKAEAETAQRIAEEARNEAKQELQRLQQEVRACVGAEWVLLCSLSLTGTATSDSNCCILCFFCCFCCFFVFIYFQSYVSLIL